MFVLASSEDSCSKIRKATVAAADKRSRAPCLKGNCLYRNPKFFGGCEILELLVFGFAFNQALKCAL
jgi:hypothetical protein